MQWIDGNEIDFKQYTGEKLCEKLSLEMWNCCKVEQWPSWVDFIQVAYFIIAFDTEVTMEGIFTFLENSIGHYAPQIIKAFREIGDDNDELFEGLDDEGDELLFDSDLANDNVDNDADIIE